MHVLRTLNMHTNCVQEQPPITSGNTAETTGATAAARAQSTDRKSNVEDISSESDPASEDPNLTTKGDRKVRK